MRSQLRARRDGWTREVVRFSDIRLLVPALLAWALLAVTLTWSGGPRWVMTGVLAVATVVALALRRGRRVLLVLAVALLVQVAGNGQHALRSVGDLDDLTQARAVVTVEATVTSDPVQLAARGSGAPVVMAKARAHRVDGRGRETPAYAPISLRGNESLLTLRWHDTVSLKGRLAPPLPGYPEVAVLRVTEHEVTERAGAVAQVAEHLRAGLRTAVDPTPADARGLLPGLVIGDTSRTPPDLTEAMQATGMTHLTAVSGTNML